jgi:putative ABC transport system permease protein
MAACAGIVGVAMGAGLLKAMIPLMPAALPKWVSFEFDARFALFCIAITGAAAVIFATLPAIQTSGVRARAALQENGARTSLSRGRSITLRGLVVAEIALALALLVSAGLVLKGFRKVSQVDPGFRTKGIMTFGIGLPAAKYAKPEQTLAFYDRLLDELRAIPGVRSAAITSAPPLGGHTGNFFVAEDARPLGPDEKNPVVLTVWATPGYLDTAGISFLNGRDITPADGGQPEKSVAIINQSFIKQYWPNLKSPADAVGKRIRFTGDKNVWMPVVGVVRDEKHYGLDEDMKPAVYMPFRNSPRLGFSTVIRGSVDPRSLAGPARDAVRKLDPDLPVYDVRILADRVRETLWLRRGSTWLFGAFAAVALILAAAGIYSVVSYAVSQRTHEIGIRMALGARPERVLGEVLRGGMTMVVIGIAAGIATAITTAGLLGTLLFGVNAKEPLVYAAVAAGVLLIGLLANMIPARRAASVDPMRALRSE